MTAPIDYNAVLADLETKRGQIDAAIAVIRSMIGTGAAEMPPTNATPASPGGSPATHLPPRSSTVLDDAHAFFRLNTPAAVKKFLGMVKRPQTVRAIADALRGGGQLHATDDKAAYTNVYTALKRGRDTDFFQTRNGEWGLAEWHDNKSKTDGE
jgi:hypothetical protein